MTRTQIVVALCPSRRAVRGSLALLTTLGFAMPARSQSPVRAAFGVAGTDSASVIGFLAKLKHAAAANDSQTIAGLIDYPNLGLWGGTRKRGVDNRRELLAAYGKIFTPQLRRSIAAVRPESLFANWQGVMFDRGRVWISGDRRGRLSIITINAPMDPLRPSERASSQTPESGFECSPHILVSAMYAGDFVLGAEVVDSTRAMLSRLAPRGALRVITSREANSLLLGGPLPPPPWPLSDVRELGKQFRAEMIVEVNASVPAAGGVRLHPLRIPRTGPPVDLDSITAPDAPRAARILVNRIAADTMIQRWRRSRGVCSTTGVR